jgi:hypothetical protein
MAGVRRSKTAPKKSSLKVVTKKNQTAKAPEKVAAKQPAQQAHPFARFIQIRPPASAFRNDRHFNPHLSKRRAG